MVTRVIRTQSDIDGLSRLLAARKLPVTIHIAAGEDRTGAQNALAFRWYNDAATQLGDRSAADVRGHCKLYHGVRMLHSENDVFRAQWDRLIKDRFTVEEKLELMLPPHDYPVTRLMSAKQMTRYMDAIHAEFTAMGVRLTDPESLKWGQDA
jgi:protein tyrosine/serine phosphatase